MARKLFWAIWKRWVATDIHLDQFSLLRKKWSPLHWVPKGEGKAFFESTSWWTACLVGHIALLSLWKSFTNLLQLRLLNKSRYMRGWCVEGIFALWCSLVDLLLLDKRCLGQGYSSCSVLLFSFWTDHEEAEFCSMRYYLETLFRCDNSWNYLWYPVEMTSRVAMTLRGWDS